jgi:hypothetical protein
MPCRSRPSVVRGLGARGSACWAGTLGRWPLRCALVGRRPRACHPIHLLVVPCVLGNFAPRGICVGITR